MDPGEKNLSVNGKDRLSTFNLIYTECTHYLFWSYYERWFSLTPEDFQLPYMAREVEDGWTFPHGWML